MTRRSLEWHLVGEDGDPVPADAWDVRQVAKQFTDRGTVMNSAATTLQRFADTDEWIGEAAKKFADKASEAHSDLDKAAQKYLDAGTALTTYAEAVDTARTETAAAVDDAVMADSSRRNNSTSLLDGVEDPSDDLQDADTRRQDRLDAANDELAAARTRLRNAMDALDTAADTCRRSINAASAHFKDGTWDDVKGAVAAVIKVLVDALSIIAIVLAVVIIVLLVVGTGGIFAFAAGIIGTLGWVAFGVGAGIFALTYVQYTMGDTSKTDLFLAAIGVVGGGLGRGASALARAAMSRASVSIVTRAADDAIKNLPFIVKFAKKIPFAPIANWSARKEGAAVADAVFDTLAQMNPTRITSVLGATLRGLELEEGVQAIRSIQAMRAMTAGDFETAALTQALRFTSASLVGSGMQVPALGVGVVKTPGTVLGFPDTLGDLGPSIGDWGDGVPARDLPEPAPTHVSLAGR